MSQRLVALNTSHIKINEMTAYYNNEQIKIYNNANITGNITISNNLSIFGTDEVEHNNNISSSDIILGVKEVDISALIENKTYLFFSHTSKIGKDNNQATQGTPGMNKKELLKEILKKNITLIDYENIRDISRKGYRYLGFGRFAGIVGCYNTLNLHLKIKLSFYRKSKQ